MNGSRLRTPAAVFAASLPALQPVLAHDLDEFIISRISKNDTIGGYEIEIDGTEADQLINCALYDGNGALLASRISFTTDIATKATVPYAGNDVMDVHCTFN